MHTSTMAGQFRRRLLGTMPAPFVERVRLAKWAVTGPPASYRPGRAVPRVKGAENPNPLATFFYEAEHRSVHKWPHYFDIYHRHFQRFRGRPIVVVEFGVSRGGSLQMWRDYFGPAATIFGVDIDPTCARFEEPGTHIRIGDQEDRAFLRSLAAETGPIHVVIEDGGHTMGQQIATFEEIYPRMSRRGVFLIEDLHTSYWTEFGGSYRGERTFMEYAKSLTDRLNAWHSRDAALTPDRFTRSTRSMHFYDSIVVFERGRVTEPHHEVRGTPSPRDTETGKGSR